MKRNYIAPSTETQYLHINIYMQTLSYNGINYGGETNRFDTKLRMLNDNDPFTVEDFILLNEQNIYEYE